MSPVLFISALALAVGADAGAANFSRTFRGTGHVRQQEVADLFLHELADSYQHLSSFEDALRSMYTSLPKNTHGKLGHDLVHYALRRYFMNRYGWLVGGLEAGSSAGGWVPDFIMLAIGRKEGKQGVDLRDLAIFAAVLEDVIARTSQERLQSAWGVTFGEGARGRSFDNNLTHDQALDALETYLMMSLSPTTWKVKDRADLARKKTYFRSHADSNFKRVTEWYAPIRERHISNDTTQEVSFGSLAKVAVDLDKKFHVYFDHDCKAMKSALAAGQGKRAGRVRLAAFYNMSLFGDWSFVEREGYLRAVGALDDANPPHVIISNYALGRLNCLNETNLYSVCCRNTCEDLMSHLEREIGASSATARVIAGLVAELPSESVEAPRELPASLLGRLDEVANHHGGEVPLHGRLFAQWLHHAYPFECPYPHEAGSSKPQSLEQWMAQEDKELSVEEIKQQVKDDSCVVNGEGDVDCGEESAELPWSSTEELLTSAAGHDYQSDTSSLAFLCLVSASVLAWPLLRGSIAAGFSLGFVRKSPDLQNRAVVVVLLLAAAAYLADLLDGAVFGAALLSCLAALGVRLARPRFSQDGCLPAEAKVV